MGNWGELTAVDGKVTLSRFGRAVDLNDTPRGRSLTGLGDYVARYGRFHPEIFMQDMPYSPDFPTVARVMEELYPQAGGQPVDGAISVDPYAIAAFLRLTGPLQVGGLPEPLTADNAANLLLRDQYVQFPDLPGRVDFLDQAARTTMSRLLSSPLPTAAQVADTLSPVVRQRRLMAHSVHADEETLFSRVGLDGAFRAVDGGDFFSVVTQNSGNNKLDIFLERDVDYRVALDPGDGTLTASATIKLRNTAPSSGLPIGVIGSTDPRLPLGATRLYLSFYTPHRLAGAALNGLPLNMEAQEELGRSVYFAFVTIPAGGVATVRLDLVGSAERAGTYSLGIGTQPLTRPDQVTVTVQLPGRDRFRRAQGFDVADPGGARAAIAPTEDAVLSAAFSTR